MIYRVVVCILWLSISSLFAAAHDSVHILSPSRGFEPYCTPRCDTILNNSDVSLYRLASSDIHLHDFVLTERVAAVNNAFEKQYTYHSADGHKHRVAYPAYGVALISAAADTLLLQLQTMPGDHTSLIGTRDYMTARLILMQPHLAAVNLESAKLGHRHVNLYTELNGITISRHGSAWQIAVGKRQMQQVFSIDLPDFDITQVGYMLAPAAALQLKYVTLQQQSTDAERVPDASELAAAAAVENDPLCGTWVLTEYNLDTKLLKSGGLYDVIIAPTDEDGVYNIVYQSGADINPDLWSPDMLKGELRSTSLPGVYDAVWYDADHRPLSRNIRAQGQTDGNPSRYDILTIRFPSQDSHITLRRTDR